MPDLLIIDSNIFNFIQPGEEFEHLARRSALEVIPARVAREEAERAATALPTPRSRDVDVPAPWILNHPRRVTNDPGVVILEPRVHKLVAQFKASEYAATTSARYDNDQLILACSVVYVDQRRAEGFAGRAFFTTRDEKLCERGDRFLRGIGASLTMLHADGQGVRPVPGVDLLSTTFPP